MEKVELLDNLRRAVEMEEEMNNSLSEICMNGVNDTDLSKESSERIMEIMEKVRIDTVRHRNIVSEIVSQMENADA
jgi:hypothetical protein